MKKLSGLDSAFLYAETPACPMNVVAVVVLEARDGKPVDFDAIVARVEERLPLLPPFRRKLVETPAGLDHPIWIEDPEFDLREHVLRVGVRPPGTRVELAEVVARAAGSRLDRSRPLWELWVVEGLEDDRVAMVFKAHHAALDGVTGAAMLIHLFDRPEVAGCEVMQLDRWRGEAEPSAAEMLARSVAALPERARGMGGALWRTGQSLLRIARSADDPRSGAVDVAKPFSAPATCFNGALSRSRTAAYARTSLERVGLIREAFGGTVNDVVLAACATAMRRYLEGRDELPQGPLVAALPVSTRDGGDPDFSGNHISAMLVELPVHLADPLTRYYEVCHSARAGKRFHTTMGPRTLEALADLTSPALAGSAVALYSSWKLASRHRPLCNLVVSNVRGPGEALALRGARVEALHPHGPLLEGAGLNITIMSYAGVVDIGVLASGQAVDELADGVATGIEELAKLADRGHPAVDESILAIE